MTNLEIRHASIIGISLGDIQSRLEAAGYTATITLGVGPVMTTSASLDQVAELFGVVFA